MPQHSLPPNNKRKNRAKITRQNVRFEATVNNGHVDLHATAPAKWFRVLFRVLVVIIIAIVILKMPELWQAIQAAIHLVPK